MKQQHSYELIHDNFNLEELSSLCQKLNLDYENLSGETRNAKAQTLYEYLDRRGRLLELFEAVNQQRPKLDLSLCLHELIGNLFATESDMLNLFAGLGLEAKDFLEKEHLSWGGRPWRVDKAKKLQIYYAEQDRWSDLLQNIANQSKDSVSFEKLHLLFPGPTISPMESISPRTAPEIIQRKIPTDSVPSMQPPLQEALERGQLALFIGADLAQTFTSVPSRSDLAQVLGQRYQLDPSLSLAQVTQRVSRAGNRYDFTDYLRNALDTTGKTPLTFHHQIVALVQQYSLRTIITTAYDDLLDRALRQARIPFQVVIGNSDVRFIQSDRLAVIKLYGVADRPDTIIVTEQDHNTLLHNREKEEVIDLVRQTFRTNTICFLGYNLADQDFQFIYDQIGESRFARIAYAVWPDLPQVEIDMWRDRKVVILDQNPFGTAGTSHLVTIPTAPGNIKALPGDKPAETKGSGESGPAKVYGQGNRWAVLIGVNKYDDWNNYGKLQVCVKDVEAIRNALIAGGYEPKRTRLITDDGPEEPSKANILTALKSVAKASEPDDSILFYYSGHGAKNGDESYLVAKDGHHLTLSDTAIPIKRIKEIISEAPAKAKIIILDACHSGADIGKGSEPMSPEFIRRVFEEAEGMMILSSCKQGQLSYEWRKRERSVFTHFLMEAVSGKADWDNKGFVTMQDASRYVVDGVKLWAANNNTSQIPTLQSQVAGDIILVDYY